MKAFKYNREDDFYLGNTKYRVISLKSKIDKLLNESDSDYKKYINQEEIQKFLKE